MLSKLTIINGAIFLLNQQDHLLLLFLIVGNYRSNDAMFTLYRSSLLNIMQRIGRPFKFPSECSAFEMRANIVLSSHNCQRLTRALKRGGKKPNRSFDQKAETFDIKLLPGNSAASLHCRASNWILMTGHKRYSLPIPLSSIRGSHRRLRGVWWLINIWKHTYIYLILVNMRADS